METQSNVLQMASIALAENADIQKMQMARRAGHNFIKVLYTGNSPKPPRLHSVHDVIPYKWVNPKNNSTEIKTKEGCRLIEFGDEYGQAVAYILDDDYNRYFLSRHLDYGLFIEDPKIRKEVEVLVGKKYDVEPSESDEIDRQIKALEERRKRIAKEEVIKQNASTQEQKQPDPVATKPLRGKRTNRQVRSAPIAEDIAVVST